MIFASPNSLYFQISWNPVRSWIAYSLHTSHSNAATFLDYESILPLNSVIHDLFRFSHPVLLIISGKQLQSTAVLPNLTNPTDRTYCSLEFGLVFASIESTDLEWRARVNRSERGSANVELGKLIKLNLVCIVGISFTSSLDFFRL